ncbi:MAG: helix-turn-helix transcriptional regulator [Pseudolabrys sp.]|jgi:transcriptional regulator with XRE-family HTH domain
MQTGTRNSPDLVALMRFERRCFAAKIRTARAILGWSQSEFGAHVGLTQRAVHKLEQGETEPRRATLRAIEEAWQAQGIEFEDMADGGFRVVVRAPVVDRPAAAADRRRQTEKSMDTGVGSLAAHIHST